MNNNKQQNTKSKCTCIEHDPYCCQIHGNCPVCVKPEEPEDVVLGYKTSLVAQTMDSTAIKQQTAVEWFFMTMNICGLLPTEEIVEYYNQAKEMEEEKMIEFAYNALKIADNTTNRYIDVDELYNKTYGGNK
jgi:hypothetical protein